MSSKMRLKEQKTYSSTEFKKRLARATRNFILFNDGHIIPNILDHARMTKNQALDALNVLTGALAIIHLAENLMSSTRAPHTTFIKRKNPKGIRKSQKKRGRQLIAFKDLVTTRKK